MESWPPTPQTIAPARNLLALEMHEAALKLLAGGCYGAGYDPEYFVLLGRALLGVGRESNVGRFLFLSGSRSAEYCAPISRFLSHHHDPRNISRKGILGSCVGDIFQTMPSSDTSSSLR